jgi:hypothetical protein
LRPGDVVVPLTEAPWLAMNVPAETRVLQTVEGQWQVAAAGDGIVALGDTRRKWPAELTTPPTEVIRLVLVGADASDIAYFAGFGREVIGVTVQAAATAADFMSEEDSEAVAERLRQLGYI